MSLPITADTKLGAMLEEYPQLANGLEEWAPGLTRVQNPVLRATVLKSATVEQAAKVSGQSAADLVRRLREAAGQGAQDAFSILQPGVICPSAQLPAWVAQARIRETIDALPMLARGEHPLGVVQQAAGSLAPGEAVQLLTPFRPEPLLQAMQAAGFAVHCVSESGRYRTVIAPAG